MHFIKRASLSDLPDFDSPPVGRLALFFDAHFIALIEFPPTILTFIYLFFSSCPRCLTVCKSFGYLESPAPGLIIEPDTSWTIIPQRVCHPVCLQCQHITMSTRVTSSIQHGRTGGRAARRFAAVRGTHSLFAPAINVYAETTIFSPDQS